MEESKSGGAKDSAGRPVSKLLISSAHAVVKDHHGSFTYQVPNNDQIHCDTPCYVGVSDLQVPVLGPAMANVVHGVNDKLYIYVAQSGSSNPNLSFHIITIPAGQYSASSSRQARCRRRARWGKVQCVTLDGDQPLHHYTSLRNRSWFRDL